MVGYQSLDDKPGISPIASSEDVDAEAEMVPGVNEDAEKTQEGEQAPPQPSEFSDTADMDSASPTTDDFGQAVCL